MSTTPPPGSTGSTAMLHSVLLSPVLVATGATAWLYLSALTYLDGFCSFYLISSHWFEPSVIRLVSFSSRALLETTIVMVSIVLLARLSRAHWAVRSALAAAWFLYFLSRLATHLSAIRELAHEAYPEVVRMGLYSVYLDYLGVAALPIVLFATSLVIERRDRRDWMILDELDRAKTAMTDLPLSDDLRAVLQGRLSRLQSEADEIVDRRKRSPARKYRDVLMFTIIACMLILHLQLIQHRGFHRAASELSLARLWTGMQTHTGASLTGDRLLFTDGARHLIYRAELPHNRNGCVFVDDPNKRELPFLLMREIWADIASKTEDAALRFIGHMIVAHVAEHGTVPTSIVDIVAGIRDAELQARVATTPVVYLISDADNNAWELHSPGPDGKWHTQDDRVLLHSDMAE